MSKISNLLTKFSPGSRILISPMEWGLGHASRCIPIIDHLINNCNASIVVAANGPQAALIRESFPAIRIVHPPAYTIKYHKNRAGTISKLALSIPRLAQQIREEQKWLRSFLRQHPQDAIISDNRYGLWHSDIPCYLLTHQLGIKTPFGRAVDALVRKQLYRYIGKFTECWVPDFAGLQESLAGELSHPKQVPPIPVRYIGPLSRFHASGNFLTANDNPKPVQLLVILSGPEPQRTLLEKTVIQQWSRNPGKSMLLVRGLPETGENHSVAAANQKIPIPNASILPHLSTDAFLQAIKEAEIILTRSGYSSVMELLPLHSNIWMVPTPGQTEQEYLARYLSEKGLIQTCEQENLSLRQILSCHPTVTRRVPDGW